MAETPECLPDGTFIVEEPTTLPDVLDMLIVGGGPAGTAAAFRAKELGLAALVIDYDDLMKRIRDYAKDKLILPDFGGGDRMRFPKSGELVNSLHFAAIDKDVMCRDWKALYHQFSIPAKVGVELVGLEAEDPQTWRVKCWNHNMKQEECVLARHVVLAFGRGVPRRLDIPGSVEGMAFGLTDASKYVGHPACVIGGGTSAAEAVIAISHAKVKAADASVVCWSYRGDKMPKVSKALADVFFEAYVGNGNIRYLPHSEPTAVLNLDSADWLCVRTDRKSIAGRPNETVQLEFLKTACIACIGEDIPEALLNSIGIRLMSGGPGNKKRMVVTPLLETERPNVYLTGDMLSPAYLEANDFNADPAGFREIKRRGNIKSAMRDGVLVAQVAKERLAGKTTIHVELEFADDEPVMTSAAAQVSIAPAAGSEQRPAASGEQSRTPTPVKRQPSLVLLLQGNVEADEHPVPIDGRLTIGRRECDVTYAEDSSLSDRHASIVAQNGGFVVQDEGSVSGVYLQVMGGKTHFAPPGTVVRLGRQWLLCGAADDPFVVVHYDAEGLRRASYGVSPNSVAVVGREAPDVTLDRTDLSLSRRHVALAVKEGLLTIKDLNSANGTFVKVDRPLPIEDGDQIWLGQRRFRFVLPGTRRPSAVVEAQATRAPESAAVTPSAPAATKASVGAAIAQPAAAAVQPASASSGGLVVTFANVGKTVPLRRGQTICEAAEEHGIHVVADCHQGICGSDPVRIVSGTENLNAMSDAERGTLEDICSLEPGVHRLACMARLQGAATVEIIQQ